MATTTTDPSRYLLNLNSLNNVITSASGATTASLSNLQALVNTSNYKVSMNTLGAFTGSNVSVTGNLNMSNSAIFFNGFNGVTSNCINGTPFLAIKANNNEKARFTSNGFGIGLTAPTVELDIKGSELLRGSLYVSSMGSTITSTLGNIYADGSIFGAGFYTPSDSNLKTNIESYESHGLPTPVQFKWKSTGVHDIGFLAQEVEALEPTCVHRRGGTQSIDYSKLVVLCVAELRYLREEVSTLKASLSAARLKTET